MMSNDAQDELREWVGDVTDRATAFMCLARLHYLNARRVHRNWARSILSLGHGMSHPNFSIAPSTPDPAAPPTIANFRVPIGN